MAYKDKDRQRAYQCQWVRQKRGSGSTITGSTLKGSTSHKEQLDLAPDGYPIQHTHSMMVGYVRPKAE